MSLLDILGQVKTVRDDLTSGQVLKAWEDLIPVQQELIALGRELGFKAGPDDGVHAKAICDLLAECKTLSIVTKSADPVGKIGDGVILGKLLDFLVKIAPIVLPLII